MPSNHEQKKGIAFLDCQQLEQYTRTFETWALEQSKPDKYVARARVYLYFLLARYGALRSSEINGFNCHENLDAETGQLRINGRTLFLPFAALRPLRRILSLPESGQANFLSIDSGFLRRTFYAIARMANLPAEHCAPRALRYARAWEMSELHMPLPLIARFLGISSVLKLEKLLFNHTIRKNPKLRENTFIATVRQIETGHWSARIILELASGHILHCLCSPEKLLAIEPSSGASIRCHIPSAAVFHEQSSDAKENVIQGAIRAMNRDSLETRIKLQTDIGLELEALMPERIYYQFNIADHINIYIPPHLIQIEVL